MQNLKQEKQIPASVPAPAVQTARLAKEQINKNLQMLDKISLLYQPSKPKKQKYAR